MTWPNTHNYDSNPLPNHSDRSATKGSTLAARRAGIHVAHRATAARSKVAAGSTTESMGLTS